MTARSRRPYSGWEDHLIGVWDKCNRSHEWIAGRLARPEKGVYQKIRELRGLVTCGLRDKKPKGNTDVKQRKCLMCGNDFRSSWSGERTCPPCKNSRAFRDGDGETYKLSGVR